MSLRFVTSKTHDFVDDRITIDELLGGTEVPYVGLMGSHERFAEMLGEFEGEGRSFSEAELDRLYTPVGLDLGNGPAASRSASSARFSR